MNLRTPAELREIANKQRIADAKQRSIAEASKASELRREKQLQRDNLLPRLTEEIERNIIRAAKEGRFSAQFTPYSLPNYRDGERNNAIYRPILQEACEAVEAASHEYQASFSTMTGIEYGSDGGYSDGICEVNIKVSWEAHDE